jgi:hypothetical protein
MKRDPRILTRAAEMLLPRLTSPLHRAIVLNYRLHAMLEVSGRGQEIFTPEMTVDRPSYLLQGKTRVEGQAVPALYQSLVDNGTSVMILDPETLMVGDEGFSSEALFHTYVTGEVARALGHAGADPARKYVRQNRICMMWPHDATGRMIGEHTYAGEVLAFDECPDDEFIDLAEVQKVFAPLIDEARRDYLAARKALLAG